MKVIKDGHKYIMSNFENKENGFNVELSFDHHPDYSGENSFYFHQKEEKNFNEKIVALKQDLTITLKEERIR